jgi:CheY-like chemotaxis protein
VKHLPLKASLLLVPLVTVGSVIDQTTNVPLGMVGAVLVGIWSGCWWLGRKLQALEDGRVMNAKRIDELETKLDQWTAERRQDSDRMQADIALISRPQVPLALAPEMIKHRILLVDDDLHFVEIFRQKLDPWFEILTASNLDEAIRKLNEIEAQPGAASVRCVLLDMVLPPYRGEEVLARFRRQHPLAVAMIISGHEGPDILALAAQHDVEGYVSKELMFENTNYVIQVIRTAIARHYKFDTTAFQKKPFP